MFKVPIKVYLFSKSNELYSYLQHGKKLFSKSVRTLLVNQYSNWSFFISIKAIEKYLQAFWSRLSKFGRLVAIYINFHLIPVNVDRVCLCVSLSLSLSHINIYIYIYILCQWKDLQKKNTKQMCMSVCPQKNERQKKLVREHWQKIFCRA